MNTLPDTRYELMEAIAAQLTKTELAMVPIRSAHARTDDPELADQLEYDLNQLELQHDNYTASWNVLNSLEQWHGTTP